MVIKYMAVHQDAINIVSGYVGDCVGVVITHTLFIRCVGRELDKETDLLRIIIFLASAMADLLFGAGHEAEGETSFLVLSRILCCGSSRF